VVSAVDQRPVDIGIDVGGEEKQSARLEDAVEPLQVHLRHEAALPVLPLRPGVRIKKIDTID